MSSSTKKAVAGILAAAIALTSSAIAPTRAAPIGNIRPAATEAAQANGFTEVRWRGGYGYGYRRNNAAAFAAFAAIAGTAIAIAAARRHRHGYYQPYAPYAPYGYYGAPGYASPYYGPRYYPY